MKVMLATPPLDRHKGVPLLSQNRQFQYFKEPTYIYPVVPAIAATMLKAAGHEVIWLDGIAEGMSYDQFCERVRTQRPDIIAMETKTPVVKQHWRIIDDLKRRANGTWRMATVLFGDHVTALPRESMDNSRVDYVLTGGDYDFLLKNLCSALDHRPSTIDDRLFEPGIWYRKNGSVAESGPFKLDHDLNDAPAIDRTLTRSSLYAFHNGNFRQTPGTYIMAGRDCWWGRCTFCSWPTLYPAFRVRRVERVLEEIGQCAQEGFREIMDDTGTFPTGDWLEDFCNGMINRGFHRRVSLDANMRFGALNESQYRKMKNANFRLLLFGLESANQKTLDRIKKNVQVDQIVASVQAARRAGLYPHITIMFGYPWETHEEALRTLALGRWLLKKGYAYTVQATLVIPYPGSPLFEECRREGWLRTQDWDAFDMKSSVMRSPIDDARMKELVQGVYGVAFTPEFIMRRIFSIRGVSDLKYFLRGFKKVASHIFDFRSMGT